MIRLEESRIDDALCETLIAFSKDWEKEDISYGYIANGPEEFAGKRIFIAKDEEKTVAYLFGHEGKAESMASAIGKGSRCFEVDEFYVVPAYRNKGIGKQLFRFVESRLEGFDHITLATSTKDHKKILHFYIEEAGMEFHSAALFKKI